MEWLASAAGHADRIEPLRNYCTGLLLDGERKSVEPMAARLAPDHVQRMHESLHHFVAQSPWKDADLLRQVRRYVLPAMQKSGPVAAWIVDETGFVKKGTHSVGVARQYCGRVGKKENCQVAVSLSVATATASLPIAWRLYLPEEWAHDPERRRQAGVPEAVPFQTKPQIALAQIQQAVADGVSPGVVLADEVYGSNREFRAGVAELELDYALAVRSTTTVWALERQPLPPKPLEWEGEAGHPHAPGPDPPTVHGATIGAGVSGASLAGSVLARGQQRNVAFPLCRFAGSTRLWRRPPRRLAGGTVVADRVAPQSRRADRLLVVEFAGENLAETLGRDQQTSLGD
jgi:SRSO17 transposase